MKNPTSAITAFFVALPFFYLASVYGELPERIPIHFDWRGIPDGWGPKYILWFLPILGLPLAFLVAASLRKKIDGPVLTDKRGRIGLLTIVFISLMICYIIYGAGAGGYDGYGWLSILLGLFFAAQGNYLPVLPRNRWMGIRIPATMNSEVKWRKTHRFAGPVFLAGGLLMILGGLFAPRDSVIFLIIGITMLIVTIPLVYALRLPDDEDGKFV